MLVKTIKLCLIILLFLIPKGLFAYQSTHYGGPEDDCFTAVCVTKDDGFVVAGWTKSKGLGAKDAWILKFDNHQKLVWEKTVGSLGNEEATDVLEDAAGNILFCGYTSAVGTAHKDSWLVKLTKKGAIKWQKTYSCKDENHALFLSETESDDNQRIYFLSGITNASETGEDVYARYVDEHGRLIREKILRLPGDQRVCKPIGYSSFSVPITTSINDSIQNWIFTMDKTNPEMDKLRKIRSDQSITIFLNDSTFVSQNASKESVITKYSKDSIVWRISSNVIPLDIRDSYDSYRKGYYLNVGVAHQAGEKYGDVFKLSYKGELLGFFMPEEELSALNRIVPLPNGCFAAVGLTQSKNANTSDGWLVVFDENDASFMKGYGDNDIGCKILSNEDGGYIVLGANPTNCAKIWKFNPDGKIAWTVPTLNEIHPGEGVNNLCQLSNKIIVASAKDSILGIEPTSGKRLFGFRSPNQIFKISPKSNNDFVVLTSNEWFTYDTYGRQLSKIVLEVSKAGRGCEPEAFGILKDSCLLIAGSHYFPGYTLGNTERVAYRLPLLVKYSPEGKLLWEEELKNVKGRITCFDEDVQGNIVTAGEINYAYYPNAALFAVFSTNGALVRSGEISKIGAAQDILVKSDGQYMIRSNGNTYSVVNPKTNDVKTTALSHQGYVFGMNRCPNEELVGVGVLKDSNLNPSIQMLLVRYDQTFRLTPLFQ